LGRSVMQLENVTAKKSDKIVSDIITLNNKSRSLATEDAVVLALYARHLKRINSHLNNIATSIVNPFPRIGFREKRMRI
jgi:phosphate uptake regulator